MSALLCRLFGHPRFVQRPLHEGTTIRYHVALRDKDGRAWSWPECERCGEQVITTRWVGGEPDPWPR